MFTSTVARCWTSEPVGVEVVGEDVPRSQEARLSLSTPRVTAQGVVFIHSTPVALCPHIAWTLESVLGQRVALEWTRQPLGPKLLRAEMSWAGEAGTGSKVASALRGWDNLRYEVTEEPSPGNDGSRWSHTPNLGIHHTWTSADGDAVINEDRLRAAISVSKGDSAVLAHELDLLLGLAWDDELEPFRQAGEGATVRWLHMVG
jgi:Protein of unknown function (DUF3145)